MPALSPSPTWAAQVAERPMGSSSRPAFLATNSPVSPLTSRAFVPSPVKQDRTCPTTQGWWTKWKVCVNTSQSRKCHVNAVTRGSLVRRKQQRLWCPRFESWLCHVYLFTYVKLHFFQKVISGGFHTDSCSCVLLDNLTKLPEFANLWNGEEPRIV